MTWGTPGLAGMGCRGQQVTRPRSVQDVLVLRGRQALFSCTVAFELPGEEIVYSWKFAAQVGAPKLTWKVGLRSGLPRLSREGQDPGQGAWSGAGPRGPHRPIGTLEGRDLGGARPIGTLGGRA